MLNHNELFIAMNVYAICASQWCTWLKEKVIQGFLPHFTRLVSTHSLSLTFTQMFLLDFDLSYYNLCILLCVSIAQLGIRLSL